MPIITDPDDLNVGTEITIDTATRLITLNIAGNLSADGVNWQALYSKLQDLWLLATYQPYPFPCLATDNYAGKYAIGQNADGFADWGFANDATRQLLRNSGWQEFASNGDLEREYLCPFSGSGVESGSQPYYFFAGDTSPTDFPYTGPTNVGIQIYGDASNGNFDQRAGSLTIRVREPGPPFGAAVSSSLPGLASSLEPVFAPLAMSEAADLNVTATDGDITTTAPYTGMSITFYATAQSRTIGASSYDFGVIVDANGGTKEEVYEYLQWALRQDADIDAGAGTQNGKLSDAFAVFVGNRLDTLQVTNAAGGGTGVHIDDLDPNDINDVRYVDNSGTYRTFPFVAAGTLEFNSNLVADASAVYRMFFTTNPAGDYGDATAVTVDDDSGADIAGSVSAASIAWDFDYDGNAQGGRTPGTDASVTVVASGTDGAQWTVATFTITRATGQTISVAANPNPNYLNP
jgi:hypothetical protein